MIEEKLLPALGIEEQDDDAQHAGDGKEKEYGALQPDAAKRLPPGAEGGDHGPRGGPRRRQAAPVAAMWSAAQARVSPADP